MRRDEKEEELGQRSRVVPQHLAAHFRNCSVRNDSPEGVLQGCSQKEIHVENQFCVIQRHILMEVASKT